MIHVIIHMPQRIGPSKGSSLGKASHLPEGIDAGSGKAVFEIKDTCPVRKNGHNEKSIISFFTLQINLRILGDYLMKG